MDRFGRLKFGRIFANAIARRVAYVLVSMALAWLGLGDAHAQSCSTSYTLNTDACPDQGSAHSAVWAAANQQIQVYKQSNPNDTRVACYNTTTSTSVTVWIRLSGSCSGANHKLYTRTFPAGNDCKSRSGSTTQAPPIGVMGGVNMQSGSFYCSSGCMASATQNADDTWTTSFGSNTVCTPETLPDTCDDLGYSYVMGLWCQPPPAECTGNQTKNPKTGQCQDACPSGMHADSSGACVPDQSECPAGQVRAPSGQCLPGDGQCAAGEARKEDGTCGRDSDGDGTADDDDEDPENDSPEETFSGGDNCESPPSCNGGSPIACGQARIQWRIDCNTRKNRNVQGGLCGAIPTCSGEKCDAVEMASLHMQWRTACALEKANSDGGTGEGGQPSWTQVTGMSQNPGDGVLDSDTPRLQEKTTDVNSLDQSGLGGGGSCVGLMSGGGGQLSSAFAQRLASPPPMFCDWIGLIKALVVLSASVTSAFILSRGGK